jgi:hypothetical protein
LVGLATVALAALPVTMALVDSRAFLAADPLDSRLTNLSNGVVAQSIAAWFSRDGLTAMMGATGLPLLLVGPAIWLLLHRRSDTVHRALIALALGPVLVALGLACEQLRWWNLLDSVLLALMVAATASIGKAGQPGLSRWLWSGGVALIMATGAVPLLPPTKGDVQKNLTESEVEEMVARDLAHWLANQAGAGGATVLASPDLTTSLCFYGGVRGLGTFDRENHDGVAATIRIVSTTLPDEAQLLIQQRGITYIVIPSWDSLLGFTRVGSRRNPRSRLSTDCTYRPRCHRGCDRCRIACRRLQASKARRSWSLRS